MSHVKRLPQSKSNHVQHECGKRLHVHVCMYMYILVTNTLDLLVKSGSEVSTLNNSIHMHAGENHAYI